MAHKLFIETFGPHVAIYRRNDSSHWHMEIKLSPESRQSFLQASGLRNTFAVDKKGRIRKSLGRMPKDQAREMARDFERICQKAERHALTTQFVSQLLAKIWK